MKKFFSFVLVSLIAQAISAADVLDLSTFQPGADTTISRCYEQAVAATEKGKALCKEKGFGDYWVCPPSREMRLGALENCDERAPAAEDQPAMLYLLGLLHEDFRYQPEANECPEHYRYQEGSGVCVYTNEHFNQLIETFPDSKYSDMAAVRKAETAYRYYECEGTVLCAIENEIAGWIEFLEKRPRSRFAGLATDRIVDSLGSLSGSEIDPRRETPRRLLQDLDNLSTIASTLSPENKERLGSRVEEARAILRRVQITPPGQ